MPPNDETKTQAAAAPAPNDGQVRKEEVKQDDKPRDETVPGGRYKRGDIFVNANGEVIEE